jgi:hypothetical protein
MIPFYTRYALNAINASRMLIGTANLYESFDQGDTLTNLSSTPGAVCALAYGGRSGGVDNPDVFYAGTQSNGGCSGQTGPESFPTQAVSTLGPSATGAILHRTALGGDITQLTSYQGGAVISLAIDPQNFKRVFVVDNANKVWGSFDEGQNWTELTGDLTNRMTAIQSVEVFSTDASGGNTVLMVGTMNGVFQLRNAGQAGAAWSLLGEGLPNAIVYDLHYDYTDQVLVAGTLGRGAWLLTNPFSQPVSADSRSRTPEPNVNVSSVRPLIPPQAPPPRAVPRR